MVKVFHKISFIFYEFKQLSWLTKWLSKDGKNNQLSWVMNNNLSDKLKLYKKMTVDICNNSTAIAKTFLNLLWL